MSQLISADSQITTVTVYPDRARVTRRARLNMPVGPQKVEFADLPLGLIPDSVRAGGQGTARARLAGVTTRIVTHLETPAEAARELETRLEAARDLGAELTGRAGVLEREQKHLNDLGAQAETFARGLALRGQKAEEQGALFDFLRARAVQLQRDLLALAREKRENDKLVEQLTQQLRALQSARPRQRYTASVEVDVEAAGELTLELTYVVSGARWTPLYDLRLSGAALDVTYLAEVSQNTGEAWQDVELALSTAQPALTLTAPELDPWYVRPAPPMPMPAAAPAARSAGGGMGLLQPQAKAARQMAADEQTLFAAAMPAAAPPEAELLAEAAAVSDSGAALTYRLSGRADVPGGGEPRKVTIAAFPLKPALDYVTAPKLAAACYRRAKVKNESAFTLLPGRAQLFEDDEYLGATELELTPPNREVELFLGADERLRVERELTTRDVDKSFIGDKRRIRYGYKVELENLRDAPQTVLVRDQLPLARDEQIKVRLEAADPRPAEHSDLNLLEWKLNVPAGAKLTVRFEFVVEHPRALVILGLP